MFSVFVIFFSAGVAWCQMISVVDLEKGVEVEAQSGQDDLINFFFLDPFRWSETPLTVTLTPTLIV